MKVVKQLMILRLQMPALSCSSNESSNRQKVCPAITPDSPRCNAKKLDCRGRSIPTNTAKVLNTFRSRMLKKPTSTYAKAYRNFLRGKFDNFENYSKEDLDAALKKP